ncbi:hypothetical protein ACFZ8E_22545 [Methylobacterium sp. HMF5984]|uniref:hypothetical protein n=1 Tax=Methylobacterium sp. HMF5984 TaxID=3367370 RepID=UPI003853116D
MDVVKEAISISGEVRVPAYGVRLHAATARLIRNLDIPGIVRHGVEQSFSLGDSVGYGLEGSVRTDVVLRDGRTSSALISAI